MTKVMSPFNNNSVLYDFIIFIILNHRISLLDMSDFDRIINKRFYIKVPLKKI